MSRSSVEGFPRPISSSTNPFWGNLIHDTVLRHAREDLPDQYDRKQGIAPAYVSPGIFIVINCDKARHSAIIRHLLRLD